MSDERTTCPKCGSACAQEISEFFQRFECGTALFIESNIIRQTIACKLLTAESANAALAAENTLLRGVVANSDAPCVHCGLVDKSKCVNGFPGCAWADDMMAGEDEAWRRLAEKNAALAARVAPLEVVAKEAVKLQKFMARDEWTCQTDYAGFNFHNMWEALDVTPSPESTHAE